VGGRGRSSDEHLYLCRKKRGKSQYCATSARGRGSGQKNIANKRERGRGKKRGEKPRSLFVAICKEKKEGGESNKSRCSS